MGYRDPVQHYGDQPNVPDLERDQGPRRRPGPRRAHRAQLNNNQSNAVAAVLRFLVQRVSRATVRIQGLEPESIGKGLLVLMGVAATDTAKDADYLADKLV